MDHIKGATVTQLGGQLSMNPTVDGLTPSYPDSCLDVYVSLDRTLNPKSLVLQMWLPLNVNGCISARS